MSEIYVPLPQKDKISLYLEQDFDGFIIGLDKFSENYNYLVKDDELEDIINYVINKNKKVFISFNKLYFNDDITDVKNYINKIKEYNISGICFSDIGVLNILNDINFKGDIYWVGNHLGTNSNTINFLEKRGVSYALLSTEITKDEIIKIKNNTNIKVGAVLYGFLNMATSSRKLLTNYFEFIDKEKNKDRYLMKDKIKKIDYNVVEKDNTNFFTNSVLNGIKFFPELIDNGIDFIFLDDYLLDENSFYNIIEAFSSLRNAYKDDKFVSTLEEVVESNTYFDTFYGFLDKKTVYKVEDYE